MTTSVSSNQSQPSVRLGVDIGGTFTDIVLERGIERYTAKVLTTPQAPEQAFLEGVAQVLAQARVQPREVDLLVHGTTLATNALIERKGAKTALVTTRGFRDTLEMGTESRYEQYDLDIDLPAPLVPRDLRFTLDERIDTQGQVLVPLDDREVRRLADELRRHGVQSVAVGLISSYANPMHERRAGELLQELLPGVPITLSAEVSPEMREYQRFSTACANAYVRPLMSSYLERLQQQLDELGFTCPLFLMLSGGGICTVETARTFPVRMVESGPAGGAIFSSHIAAQLQLDEVLSFDMGGTTAKVCFIDRQVPQTSQVFEVARIYRFRKGSGLPLRIPVIEMVEIGAGGGSIARVDALGNIQVGPDSAGSEPGPACYGRGGTRPTITDADVLLGRIDPQAFAGGRIRLNRGAAQDAMVTHVGQACSLEADLAAFGVSEIVDENMASAARVHGIESGKEVAARTMIAFGGAAPLHALRVAEKLGISRVIIPGSAGVGSAVGFLLAPVSFEITASAHVLLADFRAERINQVTQRIRAEALAVVRQAGVRDDLVETRLGFMRYVGQGHQIAIALPARALTDTDAPLLVEAFHAEYKRLYGRLIPGLACELLGVTLTVSTPREPVAAAVPVQDAPPVTPSGRRRVFDPVARAFVDAAVYQRARLPAGALVPGPAVIVEDETATVITSRFDARIDSLGYIVCTVRESAGSPA
jgi:N-methylhydantoinase A